MHQLRLRETVRVEGRDFWGRHALLTFSNNLQENGWVWRVRREDIHITPDLIQSRPRRIALVHGEHELNEFEHIGFLRAAGLEHVRVELTGKRTWPPYFGGAWQVWQAVMPHTEKSGELKPYQVQLGDTVGPICARLPHDPSRWTQFVPHSNAENAKQLSIHVTIHFPRISKESAQAVYDWKNVVDLRDIAHARTLGWPPLLYYLSRFAHALGWPHHPRIAWKQEEFSRDLLQEIAEHRLQDMLGTLPFLAPPGHHITGAFQSHKGNHQTDVMLLKTLASAKVVTFRKQVA